MANRRELTAVEASLRAGVSRERLIRKVQAGAITGRRDPERGWLVLEASLDTWLRSQSEEAVAFRNERPGAA